MIRTLQDREKSALPAGRADLLLAAAGPDTPTPGPLTLSVEALTPFAALKILDLGLVSAPERYETVTFGIDPENAFDAKAVFEKGRAFGRYYKPAGDYVILGENVSPDAADAAALLKPLPGVGLFEQLGRTADGFLMFAAGFMLEACRRFPVVLGGGSRMAAALLIANRVVRRDGLPMDPRKLTLCTTGGIAETERAETLSLLGQLDFRPRALYADLPSHEGEPYAGATVAYGTMQGLGVAQITSRAGSGA
ncbi:hypothetical protein WCX49_00815 [Sulfurimonas sp. HSL-1656]|uniref:hypothetical protein n=1 Tax=Thiomicrolovo subterrani TaxID=3131934 RepID=UPI0031F820F0